jgi:hypothetical protein
MFIDDDPLRWDDDPDFLRQVAADLDYVGEQLHVETGSVTQGLYERADEIESERAGVEDIDSDPLERRVLPG